jgi:hypothetical protein
MCRWNPSRCESRFASRDGGAAEHPGEKKIWHVKNDDGGVVPTRNGTNWVAQGWEAAALGDRDRNDCSSRSGCGNGFWSSSVEPPVVALVVSWQMGSRTPEKERRWVDRTAAAEVVVVGCVGSLHGSVRRAHCANAKKGRGEERRSFGEAVARSASISSGRREGEYGSRGE